MENLSENGKITGRTPGQIYFLQAHTGGPIKIGWAINVGARWAAIQSTCPVLLRCLGYRDGTLRDERALHSSLAPHRLHYEWFADHADVRSAVADCHPSTAHDTIQTSTLPRPLSEWQRDREMQRRYVQTLKEQRKQDAERLRRRVYEPPAA